jgi:hypothetical protein
MSRATKIAALQLIKACAYFDWFGEANVTFEPASRRSRGIRRNANPVD